ncbi:hypothetical protein JCM10207_002570 [Rhodosporidiobolus poonsookiae]
MASQAPARALRSALQASARPSTLYPRHALLAAASPFARQPQLLLPSLRDHSLRRGFASTAPAPGWFGWGAQKKDELKDKVVEAKDAVEEKTAALVAEQSPSAVAPEPTIVSTAPADLSTTTTPDAVVAAAEGAPAALEGNFYDSIFTGSLDLSGLVGAWGPHPIMRIQSLFLHLHESFPLLGHGLTWAVLIPTVTVFLRLFLFPFQVRSQANAGRMAIIQPQMLAGMNKLKDAKARGDFTGMQAAQIETQELMRKHNVNPLKNLAFPLAQAAVFTCMFFALRGLANAGLPSMAVEGFGWVTDLTVADPYYILPVASTALTLATLETGVDASTQIQTTTTKNTKMILRGVMVLTLPFIAYFPAALLLYWVSNNFLSLVQTSILKLPAVRNLLNIPTPPPKPQKGEPGYVPEPSFAEAFRNMQTGAKEKWDETAREAEQKARIKDAYKVQQQGGNTAEVYTPRKPLARATRGVSQAAAELLETGTTEARIIEAQPVNAHEAERNRRVLEARRRRLQGKR